MKADKACEQGNQKKEQGAADGSGSAVDKLKKKAEKLEKKGKLAPGCAAKYADLIDIVKEKLANVTIIASRHDIVEREDDTVGLIAQPMFAA